MMTKTMSFSLLRPSFVLLRKSWVKNPDRTRKQTINYRGTRKGRWQGNALDFTPSFSGRFYSEVQREYGEIALRARRSHRGLDSVWVVFETNVSQIPLEWKSTHNHTQHHKTKIFITPSNDKSTKGFPALESITLLQRGKKLYICLLVCFLHTAFISFVCSDGNAKVCRWLPPISMRDGSKIVITSLCLQLRPRLLFGYISFLPILISVPDHTHSIFTYTSLG